LERMQEILSPFARMFDAGMEKPLAKSSASQMCCGFME
jgi:hypothetical protein